MMSDDDDLLHALPLDLQLHIADAVGERCDRAALALASPRLLGLPACRELPSYQGLEMSLAFHHVLGGAIDEQLLRSYASRSEATIEGCEWLAGVAVAGLRIRVADCRVDGHVQKWYLMQPGSTVGALLRDEYPHVRTVRASAMRHHEGAEGAERVVRIELPCGRSVHYEGEKGAERKVRAELPPRGIFRVLHYEGEQGVERVVRIELPNGEEVLHYEGEKGAEQFVRLVRAEQPPRGSVLHYESEAGAERISHTERRVHSVWLIIFRLKIDVVVVSLALVLVGLGLAATASILSQPALSPAAAPSNSQPPRSRPLPHLPLVLGSILMMAFDHSPHLLRRLYYPLLPLSLTRQLSRLSLGLGVALCVADVALCVLPLLPLAA